MFLNTLKSLPKIYPKLTVASFKVKSIKSVLRYFKGGLDLALYSRASLLKASIKERVLSFFLGYFALVILF